MSDKNSPPLLILGAERREVHDVKPIGIVGLLLAFAIIAFFYCLFIAMVQPRPQELLGTDRDAPVESTQYDADQTPN